MSLKSSSAFYAYYTQIMYWSMSPRAWRHFKPSLKHISSLSPLLRFFLVFVSLFISGFRLFRSFIIWLILTYFILWSTLVQPSCLSMCSINKADYVTYICNPPLTRVHHASRVSARQTFTSASFLLWLFNFPEIASNFWGSVLEMSASARHKAPQYGLEWQSEVDGQDVQSKTGTLSLQNQMH